MIMNLKEIFSSVTYSYHIFLAYLFRFLKIILHFIFSLKTQPPFLVVTLHHMWVRKRKHVQESVHKLQPANACVRRRVCAASWYLTTPKASQWCIPQPCHSVVLTVDSHSHMYNAVDVALFSFLTLSHFRSHALQFSSTDSPNHWLVQGAVCMWFCL